MRVNVFLIAEITEKRASRYNKCWQIIIVYARELINFCGESRMLVCGIRGGACDVTSTPKVAESGDELVLNKQRPLAVGETVTDIVAN